MADVLYTFRLSHIPGMYTYRLSIARSLDLLQDSLRLLLTLNNIFSRNRTIGALMAFMAVNLAAARYFGFSPEVKAERKIFLDVVVRIRVPVLPGDFPRAASLHARGGRNLGFMGAAYVVLKVKVLGQPVAIDFSES